VRNRNNGILIYLSEREKNHLSKQAQISGLSKSQFIRKLIMGIEIHPRPPDNIAQLIREINAIGNNINQIAHKANACDKVMQEDLYKIQQLLGEIYREVKK
jgi:hypothetical protein